MAMLKVTYRKNGIRLTHCWFASPVEIANEDFRKDAGDLIYLHGIPQDIPKITGVRLDTQRTIVKQLGRCEDELFHSLGKHLQQYIHRSQREGLVATRIIECNNWDIKSLTKLRRLYEKMFHDKGLAALFNQQLFLRYAAQGALTVGIAYEKEEPIGFSAVIYNDCAARLWLAAFDFRNEHLDSQVLSRAHQRLDWEILCWANKKSIKNFDFGGVNSFDEPDGIAEFKMKFERENKVIYDNWLVPNNFIGELALKLFLLLRR